MDAPDNIDIPDSVSAPHHLAQALASRICHDLVSPVGAIQNGTDLLREIGAPPEQEEIDLIAQSADRAAAVLAFHRLAFGFAGEETAEMRTCAVARDVTRMLSAPRIEMQVIAGSRPSLPRSAARLAALMALAGRGLLGMTGRVVLGLPSADGTIAVEAGEVDLERRGHLIGAIDEPSPAPEPREVEYALLRPAAEMTGHSLTVALEGTRLRIEARAAA